MKLISTLFFPFMLPATVMATPAVSAAEEAKAFEARYILADVDRSGGLSKAEVANAAAPGFPLIAKNFEVMDANKDGQVTLAERNAAIQTFVQNRQVEQQKAGARAKKEFEDRFARADTNKDGALSKKEVETAAAPGFPVLLKNFDTITGGKKNGKVTLAEFENFLKADAKRQMEAQQAQARKTFETAFAAADTNKSGGLSKREVDNAPAPGFPLIKKQFDAMDANRDSQVSIEERNAFVRKLR